MQRQERKELNPYLGIIPRFEKTQSYNKNNSILINSVVLKIHYCALSEKHVYTNVIKINMKTFP